MKKILNGFISKKLLLSLLTMALLLSGLCFLSPEGSEALASDSSTSTFKVEQLEIGNYTEKDENNNIVRKAPKPSTTSDYRDWIFAGWYTNEACTGTVSKTTETGTYYAKFVPSEVLSAKCQVSADTTSATSTSTSKLRIVSTVDSLKYSQVGFDLVFKGKTIPYSTNKVYSKIEAAADGVKYGFSPNIFDLQSEYFITATLINIKSEDFDEGILIKPYWVTKDGTKVYGVSRYARVEDSYLGIVNVPVRLYSDAEVTADSATVAYDNTKLEYYSYDAGYVFDTIESVDSTTTGGKIAVSAKSSSGSNVAADGMLVNLRLKTKTGVTLPKKNEFAVVMNSTNVYAPNVVYMNYITSEYSGVADESWYNTADKSFVITTPEELYGLASLSKTYSFSGQTIYLGADITIDSDWTASATAPSYAWPQIGTSGSAFAGTFDGQRHTINGIYVNDTADAGYVGLFAYASGEIKNFSLENSYFGSTGNMVGSIVGYMTGSMKSVSSNADVVNSASATDDHETGGLVGRFGSISEASISNCLFSGTVTSSSRDLGGIVGRIARGTKFVEHCLNAGTVHSTINTGAWVGGLVGSVDPQISGEASLILKDSLNVGDITRANAVYVIGSAVGYINDAMSPTVTIENTYATNESYVNPAGTATAIGAGTVANGSVGLYDKASIKGYTGYSDADFALSFYTNTNKSDSAYWVTRTDNTPMLKTFADNWADYGWYSASAKEVEIETVQELYGFSEISQTDPFGGDTVKLVKDITVNEGTASNWGSSAPKKAWTPIGKTTAFAGTFDGQGHIISGIYVNDTAGEGYVGLFAQASGTVQNLSLKNSYFASNGNMIGSVVGFLTGNIDSVYSSATIENTATKNTTGAYECGGLVGRFGSGYEKTISNCWFDGIVTSNNRELGGLVGRIAMGKKNIEHCFNTGTVHTTLDTGAWVGGLVGSVNLQVSGNGTLILADSMNVGEVTRANAVYVIGSVIGFIDDADSPTVTIENTYATNESYVNPAGVATAIGAGTVASGSIGLYDEASIKGYTGYSNENFALSFYTNTNKSDSAYWVTRTNDTPMLKTFADDWSDYGWYSEAAKEVEIETVQELYGFSEISQTDPFGGDTIKLVKDITVNEGTASNWGSVTPKKDWSSIGKTTVFAGSFDGQGHTISGIYVNDTDGSGYVGVFAQASGTVKNLSLKNSYFASNGNMIGSVVGFLTGNMEGVYSNATVVNTATKNTAGAYECGGLVGRFGSGYEKTISNSWFDGTVISNNRELGGIVGRIAMGTKTMERCLNTGTVHTTLDTGAWVGGLVGSVNLQVSGNGNLILKDSINVGEVTRTNAIYVIGSVIGFIDDADSPTVTIENTYATNESYLNPAGTATAIGAGTVASGSVQLLTAAKLTGAQARYNTPFGFYGEDETTDNWVTRQNDYPGLTKFVAESERYTGDEEIIADTSWYKKDATNGSTYVIDTAAKLYGLAEAEKLKVDSYFYATVKLGADITVNIGDADEWGTTAAVNNWTPIGSVYPFTGKFDGQGYTIKGLYMDSDTQYSGLFAQVNSNTFNSEVNYLKNFRIENSYFRSSASNLGSVAGSLATNMSNVYSNAIVATSNKSCGGLAGQFNGAKTISNCWFEGNVTSTCTEAQQGCGGLVGLVDKAGNKIENCLNTGDVTVISGRTGQLLGVGGLVGMSVNATNSMIQLKITDCINAGVVSVDHPRGTGSVIGVLNNTTEYTNTLILTNVYTTNQYIETSTQWDWTENICTGIGLNLDNTATVTGAVIEVSEDDRFIGYAAYDTTEKLDFETTWVLRKNGVPALKNFVPESAQYTTVDTDLALATLGTDITLRGNGVDAGDGSYVISVSDTDGTIYTNYLAALEEKGFTEYANNDAGLATQGVQNVVYTKSEDGLNWVVNVTHAGNEKQKTYVAVSTSEVLSSHLKGAVTYTKDDAYTTSGKTATLTMMQLTDTSASGNSFVIQLSNGHFIINDGGFAADLSNLIAYLKELSNGQKPIVEAWVISHAHSDHWGIFEQIYKDSRDNNHNWADELYVEGIYYNESAAYVKGNFEPTESSSTGELLYDVLESSYNEKVKRGIDLLKTTGGNAPEVYRYRTGQRFTFADVTMDVVQMEEQILEYLQSNGKYNDGSNGTSTSVMFTINGKRVYIGGDESSDNMLNFTKKAYNDTYFNNLDVYVAPHHGSNTYYDFGSWCTNAGNAKFGMVLFPCVSENPPYWQGESPESNYKLITEFTTDQSVYTYANGNVVLTFGDTISVSK